MFSRKNYKNNKLISSNFKVSYWKNKTRFYFNEPYILIPDLVNIQRLSFQNFILSGFTKLFQKKKTILFQKGNQKLELVFFPEWIRFKKPEFSSKKARHYGKTYGSFVYIPVLVKFSGWKKHRLEWLVLGFLPLITKQGHFLINGITRVVLNQIIRNPGIYILANDSRTRVPTIRIIPEQGSWINITIDKKYRMWITTRFLRRKVSLLIFLQALGLSISEICTNLQDNNNDFESSAVIKDIVEASRVKDLTERKKETLTPQKQTRHDRILLRAQLKGQPFTQSEAQRYLYAHFLEYKSTFQTRDEMVTDETSQEFFSKYLWNEKNRTLGFLGRKQFCKKLGILHCFEEEQLTKDDICLAAKSLLKLICYEQQPDELDSLNNKRIRGCGEFLYDNLNRGFQEFEAIITRKFTTLSPKESPTFWRFNRSLLSKLISKSWKSFFTSGTLSQYMDETNPLAEITHKRRLTVLGPGGISGKQTTIQIRGIHPTFYGRLCPIETPEGQNAGLVSSFTIFSQRNSLGDLETPFYEVYQGQVQKEIKVSFLSPSKEAHSIIAPADIKLSPWNQLPKTELPVRKNWNFEYTFWNQLDKQSIGHLQMISIATSLIPFLEHDDGNRALMGSNMQRQAVPLLRQEFPIVRTGLETRILGDGNFGLRTPQTGYITRVSSSKIQLYISKHSRLPNSTIKTLLETKKSNLYSQKFSDYFFQKNNLYSFPFTKTKALESTNIFVSEIKEKQFKQNENRKTLKTKPFISQKSLFFEKTNYFDFSLDKAFKVNLSENISYNLRAKKQNKQKVFFSNLNVFCVNKKNNFFTNFLQNSFNRKQKIETKKQEIFTKKNTVLVPKTNNYSFSKTCVDYLSKTKVYNKNMRFISKNSNFLETNKNNQKLTFSSKKQSSLLVDVYKRTNQSTCVTQRPFLNEGQWSQIGDILADGASSFNGKLALGKDILVAYLPWEGYNFEDAILISNKLLQQDIFTSLHIDFYDIEVKNTQYGLESITKLIPLEIDASPKDILRIERLDSRGLVKIGTWVEEGDYLVGKISPLAPKGRSVQQQYEKLYNVIMQRETTSFKNTSLRVPKGVEGFVLDVQIFPPKETEVIPLAPKGSILRVRVALLQKRSLQVGDKMAGRHGNKGVISKILRCEDMPYLPDGTPIDIVLNPLGVPSRMNVGQILEALLGLAGKQLRESYKIQLFDEKFGSEASRSLVYSKLYEASLKTGNPWLFEPHHPGKIKLFDGRTGESFDQPVTVGYAHMLKLIHLVDDKIHARATGPYSAVTQQPVRGRARNGGQRLGEMEVWALQAYGAAYTLQELLTIKSDDIDGRKDTVFRLYKNRRLKFGQPESFKVILRELQSLCFDLQLSKYDKNYKKLVCQDLKFLENF